MGGVDSEPLCTRCGAVPCSSTEKGMQIQGLHARDETTDKKKRKKQVKGVSVYDTAKTLREGCVCL